MDETSEILKTIRNIKRSAAETDATSIAAANIISAQGEEISSIARDSERVDQNLNISGRMIKGFSSLTSRIGNWLSPAATASQVNSIDAVKPVTHAQPTTVAVPLRLAGDEGDAALDEVSSILQGIKHRTLELSSNLKSQNATLDKVSNQVDGAIDKLSTQHSRIKSYVHFSFFAQLCHQGEEILTKTMCHRVSDQNWCGPGALHSSPLLHRRLHPHHLAQPRGSAEHRHRHQREHSLK